MLRIILSCLLIASPAGADCRLALALAVDVSRSVDAADFVIQTEGLAAALEDDAVRQAIFAEGGTVALAVYFWSGRDHQQLILGWTEITSPGVLDGVVDVVRRTPRPKQSLPTALGRALSYGHTLLSAAPACRRRVLDMAGDGRNNDGMSAAKAYERADFADIVVNGLAVGEHETDVVDYYRNEVIRGIGAFVEVAPTQADYPPAIRRKLLRELTEAVALNAAEP
ncbi:MAG: DUF1194 domain-containing protein [Tabrizicola sp.]|nr:DUF1194 domain-containing protein [Tabrizicola sp.]